MPKYVYEENKSVFSQNPLFL